MEFPKTRLRLLSFPLYIREAAVKFIGEEQNFCSFPFFKEKKQEKENKFSTDHIYWIFKIFYVKYLSRHTQPLKNKKRKRKEETKRKIGNTHQNMVSSL
jgi:hypothetical protein